MSGAFWVLSHSSWNAAAFSAVAPFVWSTELARDDVGATSAGAAAFAVVAVAIAVWRPRSWLASGVAHLSVAIYFFWSFMLIGIGV